MVSDGPTWAVAVCSAGVAPFSPVYQKTVLAAVPATSAVAVANGGPATRSGVFTLSSAAPDGKPNAAPIVPPIVIGPLKSLSVR